MFSCLHENDMPKIPHCNTANQMTGFYMKHNTRLK